MDSLDNLIKLLEPNQKPFVSQHKNTEPQTIQSQVQKADETLKINLKQKLQSTIINWKQSFKLSENDCKNLEIQPIGRRNSLYASLLSLLHPKFSLSFTYSQKQEIMDNFLRLLISKMEIDTKIKLFMKTVNLKSNTLIDEIKDSQYQSQNVIYYISLILDLNIIVLSQSEIELYFCEDKYDNCKPHILLYKDFNQIYYPVTYKTLNETQLLIYHDHQLVRTLTDNYNKKIICKKNYEKIIKPRPQLNESSTLSYKTLLVAELRKFAESKGIKTIKMGELTNRRTYKTKAELIAELDNLRETEKK